MQGSACLPDDPGVTIGPEQGQPPAASADLRVGARVGSGVGAGAVPGGPPGGAAPFPLVDAGGNRTVSVEALLLWRHPQSGDGSSAESVPLAEESPLIVDIGRWVLRQTCAGAAVPRLTGVAS